MAAEFCNESVKLKINPTSTKNGKLSKYIFPFGGALIFCALIGMFAWLIVIQVNVQNLQDLNKIQSDTIQILNTLVLKSNAREMKIHEKSKQLVNGHLSKSWFSSDVDDSLTKIRDDFLRYISDDIYTKVSNHGYFFRFEHKMTFHEGKERCQKINGHVLEFDETDKNVHDIFSELIAQFDPNFGFWIGLTDEENEGSFKWSKSGIHYSKMPHAMALWTRGEPNNLPSENCVKAKEMLL